MQRGLEGRRIAVIVEAGDDAAERRAATVIRALEGAGAKLESLRDAGKPEQWHAGAYAGLVLVGGTRTAHKGAPEIVQMVREFLVSDKPVAAFGGALTGVFEAGGVAGRTVAAGDELKAELEKAGAVCVDEPIHVDGNLITAQASADADSFAARVVQELSDLLEEHELDEMSDMSFPASDPPATSPASIGHLAPDRNGDARP
jgi:protease I